MEKKQIDTFCPASRQEWRLWLEKNHSTSQSVWLLCYKKKANVPTISWGEAVEEALCFGWIDSIRKSIDDEKFIQYFGRRKPKSVWSKINKDKVQELMGKGLMTEAGLKTIDVAKQNGSWNILDEVEQQMIPLDLETELESKADAKEYFLNISKSSRKAILQWLAMAKQPQTRQKRISEIAELASQQLKPKQFR